ncbi:MAG: oligosaccharide flippase family protein [Oscillospiraceae bacterium]|nr:oligosaccharide flippase family protein [Oscillospiraceae bacterium]
MTRGRKLLYNTLLLTGAAMFMRAAVVSFQVYLAGVIGAAGIGLFQLVASTQFLAMTVAISGIRFATTRLVSEEMGLGKPGAVPRVMIRCFSHALFFGTLAGTLLFLGSSWIGNVWIGDGRTILSLRLAAISLPFISCTAVMNGYFTAVSRVAKSATVQVTDQIIRIAFVVALLTLYPPDGLEMAAAQVVLGGVSAEILSTIKLFLLYRHDKGSLPKSNGESPHLTRRLLGISMPLAASSYVRSALNTLQHMLIPRGLRRGGAEGDQALASYGVVHGMAFPVIIFPSAIFYAVAELMVPELTASQVAGNKDRISYLVSKLLRIALYLSIGLAGLFLAFSGTLGEVIYPHTPGVGAYIRVLSLLMPIMFLDAITDGMLKGLGQQVYSMGVNIVDSFLSVVLVYLLLPIFGIQGFIWIAYFTECFNFILSLRRIAQITTIRLALSDVIKPALSILAAVYLTLWLLRTFGLPLVSSAGSLILHFLLAGVIYLALLRLLGCITPQDLRWVKRLVSSSA